jgi:hypothetical protein
MMHGPLNVKFDLRLLQMLFKFVYDLKKKNKCFPLLFHVPFVYGTELFFSSALAGSPEKKIYTVPNPAFGDAALLERTMLISDPKKEIHF